MDIKLKKIVIENFKGIKQRCIDFAEKSNVKGVNASGKTTVFDSFTFLLFNKNSAGVEKFEVRPLDSDGKQIDNIEIKVVATLEVDGKEVELSKVQKQKWVKKRSSEEQKFEGNVNSFEIDGYPKSEADYKAYIASLVNEDLFKMLTNPQYFPSMKWKEQRDILMRFVSDFSDVEIAQKNVEKYMELIPELEKAPGTEDIKAKYTKALSEWKKKQGEIPVRIDELSKQKVDFDVAELELQKNALTENISECDSKMKSNNKVVDDLEQKRFELKMDINECIRKANESIINQRTAIQNQKYDADAKMNDAHRLVYSSEKDIESKKLSVEKLEEEKKKLGDQYFSKKAQEFDETPFLFDDSKWKFDENSTVCSMCGQTLPADKIEQLKAEFESKKANAKANSEDMLVRERVIFNDAKKSEMDRIVALGNEKKSQIETLNSEIQTLEDKLPALKDEEIAQNKLKNDLEQKLSELPKEADLSSNEEYVALMKKDTDLALQIEQAKAGSIDTSAIEKEKSELTAQLDEVNAKLAKAANNIQIDERISELEEEQKNVSQKVADQEKMLYLLKEFIREKMNLISDSINSNFDSITIALFENQINGGMKEKCEIMYKGVPYSSLNSGHRIVAGLEIIKALQKLYGISAPIFIDNAESLNDFNLPAMDCQMILLSVSDDKELVVE